MEVETGVRLPPCCHCAFKGCNASTTNFSGQEHWAMERWLFLHLKHCHADEELRDIATNCCRRPQDDQEMTLLAYYMAAVREKERQHMPLIGPSVDRRNLAMVHKLACSDNIQGLICFACAQIYTHVKSWNRMWPESSQMNRESFAGHDVCEIKYYKIKDSLFRLLAPKLQVIPTMTPEKQAEAHQNTLIKSLTQNLLLVKS
jgi:hypothetical protein